ncbi:ABC transporter substrate-binding protein [Streptomyces shenzhenensis]
MNLARTPAPRRRTGRTASALAMTTALGLGLASCSGNEEPKVTAAEAPTDGVLRLGFLQDPGQPPDPDVYYASSGLALTTNLYEGLVQYAEGGGSKIVADLATSWSVDKSNTVFTFHLRRGVTFHDGTPLTSAAVQASFERRLAVGGGPGYMAEGVKSFATPDPYTSVITLKTPNSAFLSQLASPYGVKLMSPTGLEQHAGTDHAQTYLKTHDLGTGPYTLTVARTDDRYQMKAYDGYRGAKPAFSTVEFTVYKDTSAQQLALNNGNLAAIIGTVPAAAQTTYAASAKLRSYALPSFQVGVLYMNPHRPFLAKAAGRKALFEAIDWKSIIEQILPKSNVLATSAYAQGSLPDGTAPVKIVHDPGPLASYAASLPKGTKVTIGVNTSGTDIQQISELVAAQLQALGLDATVTQYQTSEIFGNWHKNPEDAADLMISTKTYPDSPNPYLYGHVFWDPDGGLNHLGCSDPDVTAHLQKGLASGSDQEYAAAAAAEQKAMCTPIWSFARDFVVAQPWLGRVAESHSVAAPNTLDFDQLTITD